MTLLKRLRNARTAAVTGTASAAALFSAYLVAAAVSALFGLTSRFLNLCPASAELGCSSVV